MSTLKVDAVSAKSTNGNLVLSGDGSGVVKIGDGELSFPDADGSSDQVIKTDGSGVLSFVDAAGGGANSVDSDQYVDGSIDSVHLAADVITSAKIADDAIDSEHYTDGSIDNAHIADDAIDSEHYAAGSIDTAHLADDAVTLAKMATGVDGSILTYDASGNPVHVGPGSDGEVLTSTGAGSPPAFEAAAGGGKMLQVVSTTTTTNFQTSSTSYVDVPNLTASITPADTGSKVLILVSLAVFTDSDNSAVGEFKIVRTIGGTATNLYVFSQISHNARQSTNHFLMQLDSPSTTSAATYKLQVFITDQSGFLQINRNDNADIARSVITLIEVGA